MLATVPTLRRPALRRSEDANALLRALLKSADAGGQAMEKYCRMLHRDLAARLRTHNPLPGRLLPYLCRAAEERTGNP